MEMLSDNEEKWWKRGVWFLSILAVSFVWIFYHMAVFIKGAPLFPTIKPANIPTILGIVTSFSITMTGFIAAIGAYLLSVSKNSTFIEWRNSGYLSVFFNLYGAAIIFLLITFGACLMMLLVGTTMWWLKLILSFVVINLIHIMLITYIVINQSKAHDINV